MPLSDEDRSGLRAFWLSEPLPEHLAEALSARPAPAPEPATARPDEPALMPQPHREPAPTPEGHRGQAPMPQPHRGQAEARQREAAFQRQQEMREYLHGLGLALARQTRRLILSYSPAAAARLVELMRGENLETSRKAAVDLLRLHETSVKHELADAADESALEGRALADSLSEEQYRQLLEILADAGAGARAGGGLADLPAPSVGPDGGADSLGAESDE